MTAKSASIKGAKRKFGGCAWKAVRLTSGDLPHVSNSGLRKSQGFLTVRQKSAEGVVTEARTGERDTDPKGQKQPVFARIRDAAAKARTEGKGK
jgi:hypothetical protein